MKAKLLVIVGVMLIILSVVSGCSSIGLSKEDAVSVFVEARGGAVSADSVTVNGIVKCDVSDQTKIQYGVNDIYLVNYTFLSPVTNGEESIVLAIGAEDSGYKVVAQGACP